MPDIGDLSFLLNALPGGALPLPPVPDGAVDPWTGAPLNVTASGAIPPLAAPVVVPIELPVDAPIEEAAAAPAPAVDVPEDTVTLPAVATPTLPSGTPITREEVLELLSEMDATIYLMV